LLIGAALLAASSAFADLGDTYPQACAKNGGQGFPDHQNKQMVWQYSNHIFGEIFTNNRSVCVILTPAPGRFYTPADAQRIFAMQSAPNQVWQAVPNGDPRLAGCWQTTDSQILGTLYRHGHLQIAYSWWIKGKRLLDTTPPNYGTPPVEDVPAQTVLTQNYES
jgi:hypothetical protein